MSYPSILLHEKYQKSPPAMSALKSIRDKMASKVLLGRLISTAQHCRSAYIYETWQCSGRD